MKADLIIKNAKIITAPGLIPGCWKGFISPTTPLISCRALAITNRRKYIFAGRKYDREIYR